jgi:large subunit ribosomal protein L34
MKQKGTYQPKTKKRAKVHGFLKRMKSASGRKVIKLRRLKGRKKLTVSSQ